jgi:glycosyltransferase involved in cell wall biosynthesis
MGKLKIGYILERFPSPTEYFILNEILQLEKRGIEIYIIVIHRQDKYLNLPELNDLCSPVIYLPKIYYYFPILNFFFTPSSFFQLPAFIRKTSGSISCSLLTIIRYFRNYCLSAYLAKQMKGYPCSHIHAHFAFISLDIAFCLSILLNIDYSLTVHARDIYTNENKIKDHLGSLRFLITCTNYNKDYLNKITDYIYEYKIYKIYHGIDIKKWTLQVRRNRNHSVFHILSVARLIEKKGLIYLIKAISILVAQGIRIHCTIIGEGELKQQLLTLIKAERIHNFVRILPFVTQDRIRELLLQSDVFVLPSIIADDGDRDGLPNVIIESMLSGLPVVSTSVSGIPEVVKHMETGLLVREKDELSIVNAINFLMNDKEIYAGIVRNARKKILELLNIESCTDELVDVLESNLQI